MLALIGHDLNEGLPNIFLNYHTRLSTNKIYKTRLQLLVMLHFIIYKMFVYNMKYPKFPVVSVLIARDLPDGTKRIVL